MALCGLHGSLATTPLEEERVIRGRCVDCYGVSSSWDGAQRVQNSPDCSMQWNIGQGDFFCVICWIRQLYHISTGAPVYRGMPEPRRFFRPNSMLSKYLHIAAANCSKAGTDLQPLIGLFFCLSGYSRTMHGGVSSLLTQQYSANLGIESEFWQSWHMRSIWRPSIKHGISTARYRVGSPQPPVGYIPKTAA